MTSSTFLTTDYTNIFPSCIWLCALFLVLVPFSYLCSKILIINLFNMWVLIFESLSNEVHSERSEQVEHGCNVEEFGVSHLISDRENHNSVYSSPGLTGFSLLRSAGVPQINFNDTWLLGVQCICSQQINPSFDFPSTCEQNIEISWKDRK